MQVFGADKSGAVKSGAYAEGGGQSKGRTFFLKNFYEYKFFE